MQVQHVYTFPGHSKEVKAVCFLGGGRLASCGFDGALRLWSLPAWRQVGCALLDTVAFSLTPLPGGVSGGSSSDAYILFYSLEEERAQDEAMQGAEPAAAAGGGDASVADA